MAQKKIKSIIWSNNAAKQYFDILEFLAENAPQALPIVGNALLDAIETLPNHFNNFAPDRFKKNNDGSYRSAVVYSYRISFRVTTNSINILRIRHASRKPLNY